jgi:hypothetical protein
MSDPAAGAADRTSRAGLRRLVAIHADARRGGLRPRLVDPAVAGPAPITGPEHRFADYLLDGCGGPLAARGAPDLAWFERSLLVAPIAPGSAVAVADDLAAIVAAPRLVAGGRLAERALAGRFASRGDVAIAAAVAQLAPEAAAAAIAGLAAAPGRDEDRLHLALLQAGGALAWRADLVAAGGAAVDALIDRLVGLVDRASAKPLLAQLAPILGAIAGAPGGSARRAREAVAARLGEAGARITGRRAGASFLDEFRALDRPRAIPDEDHYRTLPDRLVAEACAQVLGRSAEAVDLVVGAAEFVALQGQVVGGELGTELLPAFIDGLVGAAAIAPLTELVGHLLDSPDEEPRRLGLEIGARVPLDDCGDAYLAALDDARPRIRVHAVRAVTLLAPERAAPALIARLDDPEPGVCAQAARALVELGERAAVEARRMPAGLVVGRTRERAAAARAALGDASVEVASVLLPLVAAEAERQPDPAAGRDDAPLAAALTSVLRGTADGILLAAAVVRELPDALPIVALALAGDDDAPSVALPEALRAQLAAVLDPVIDGGGEAGALALATMARLSLGDAALIERIAGAGDRLAGYAGQALAALASVRRRSERAAEVLAPYLDSPGGVPEYLGAAIMAAAVAGVALPDGHPLWAQIEGLHALGTAAAAAAHAALVSRARVSCDGGGA